MAFVEMEDGVAELGSATYLISSSVNRVRECSRKFGTLEPVEPTFTVSASGINHVARASCVVRRHIARVIADGGAGPWLGEYISGAGNVDATQPNNIPLSVFRVTVFTI